MVRALDMAVDALRRAGHEVIAWEPEWHPAIFKLSARLYTADGGQDFDEITKSSGEPRFEGAFVGRPEDKMSAWQVRLPSSSS